MKSSDITTEIVDKVAKLANLPLSEARKKEFAQQLNSVLDYVSKIQSLQTKDVIETSQVTGLENVLRDDVIDDQRMLTQEESLSNAQKTHKGFFVVPAIFEDTV